MLKPEKSNPIKHLAGKFTIGSIFRDKSGGEWRHSDPKTQMERMIYRDRGRYWLQPGLSHFSPISKNIRAMKNGWPMINPLPLCPSHHKLQHLILLSDERKRSYFILNLLESMCTQWWPHHKTHVYGFTQGKTRFCTFMRIPFHASAPRLAKHKNKWLNDTTVVLYNKIKTI